MIGHVVLVIWACVMLYALNRRPGHSAACYRFRECVHGLWTGTLGDCPLPIPVILHLCIATSCPLNQSALGCCLTSFFFCCVCFYLWLESCSLLRCKFFSTRFRHPAFVYILTRGTRTGSAHGRRCVIVSRAPIFTAQPPHRMTHSLDYFWPTVVISRCLIRTGAWSPG